MKNRIWTLLRDNADNIRWVVIFTVLVITIGKLLVLFVNPPDGKPAGNLSPMLPEVRTIHDRNDNLVSLIRQQELDRQHYINMVDSLSRALKVKSNQVKTVDRYIIRTDTVVMDNVEYIKTTDSVRFAKKDAYLDLLVVGKDSGISYLRLKHTDTLQRSEIRHRPLFKPAYSEIYLRSASPYNRITHGAAFTTKSPRAILTIGPYAGFDPFSQRVAVGIGIQVPIFTIYKK